MGRSRLREEECRHQGPRLLDLGSRDRCKVRYVGQDVEHLLRDSSVRACDGEKAGLTHRNKGEGRRGGPSDRLHRVLDLVHDIHRVGV